MRAFVDTNILYSEIVRELILALGECESVELLTSESVIEEWRELGRRRDLSAEIEAEIVSLRLDPRIKIKSTAHSRDDIFLDDPHDVHVLAGAVEVAADIIITDNWRDFPAGALAPFGLRASSADQILLDYWRDAEKCLENTLSRRIDPEKSQNAQLKRAGLYRFAKLLRSTN